MTEQGFLQFLVLTPDDPVLLLAYPYNSVRGDVQRLAAEAGYRVAVAGPVHGGADLLNLARIPVKSHTSVEDLQHALTAHGPR